jgi:hypothetical protein
MMQHERHPIHSRIDDDDIIVESALEFVDPSAVGIGRPLRSGTPSRLSAFILAKYNGGSGWPSRIASTNASSPRRAASSIVLNRFS